MPDPVVNPQLAEFCKQIVPVSLGTLIVLLPLAGVTKFKVLVTPPDVAASEVEAPPCRVKVCPVAPIVKVPAGGLGRVPIVFEIVGLEPVRETFPPEVIPLASVKAPADEMVFEAEKN